MRQHAPVAKVDDGLAGDLLFAVPRADREADEGKVDRDVPNAMRMTSRSLEKIGEVELEGDGTDSHATTILRRKLQCLLGAQLRVASEFEFRIRRQ